MACLSVHEKNGLAFACANPIYIISDDGQQKGARLVFEVLEVDATGLKLRLGKRAQFGIDPARPMFLGELTSLEPCISSHLGLALLRDKPTLRGVITIDSEVMA